MSRPVHQQSESVRHASQEVKYATIIIGVLFAATSFGSVAWSQGPVPVGGQFLVNTYTTSNQEDASVASLADGRFVIVWDSFGSSGSDSDVASIQRQLYAVDGSALGGELQVNTHTSGFQTSPSVAALPDGGYVVVWQTAVSHYYRDIHGQRFAVDGSAQGGEFQVNTHPSRYLDHPAISALAGGGFVVVWQSETSSGADNSGRSVQARLYASDGSAHGEQFQVNVYTTGFQNDAAVAGLADGGFVAVWDSAGSSGSDKGKSIQGRRYAADGSDLGGEFQVNSYTDGWQEVPSVAAFPDGGFVVVWASDGSAGSDDSSESIQGRRFSADGSALGEDTQINARTFGSQWWPSVAALADGSFVTVWGTRNGSRIGGRRHGVDGLPLGDEFPVNTYGRYLQSTPNVAVRADADFVVAWSSYGFSGPDPSGNSVQSQRFVAPRFTLVGLGEKCLDVAGADPTDGTPVNIFRCHGGENQLWRMDLTAAPQKIRGIGGKCLIPGDPDDSGDPRVTIGECGGTESAVWQLVTTGPSAPSALIHAETGLCLDVEGAVDDDGTPAILFDCHGGANQVWRVAPKVCTQDSEGLCLNRDRFRIDVEWRSFDGTVGTGQAKLVGADDSGLFWFFESINWEMLIKVLDGCAINDRFWVFAAATTTVEYTLRVTDTALGTIREYFNPLGNAAAAITDTGAFASCAAAVEFGTPVAEKAAPIGSGRLSSVGQEAPASGEPTLHRTEGEPTQNKRLCIQTPTNFCLRHGRFSVEVEWRDHLGNTGLGRAVHNPFSTSGLFWFFNPDNLEMLVKVLNACRVNGHYWLLAAATTDIEYTLRVTHTQTGELREYFNPLGNAAEALVDTFACP